jgi:PilZ domain
MQNQSTAERRGPFRRRALMAALVRAKTHSGTHSCVIRNLSTSGAMLACSDSMWLPEHFELEIPKQDIRINARAVWRSNEAMGIEFLGKLDRDARSVEAEEKVIYLKAQRDALQQRLREMINPY